jgi:hypothetical protein
MLRHDHEALLHGAIDGTLTLEERDTLRELLAHDADARHRFGELERLNALLASLGPAEAPPNLVAEVLARVSAHSAAPQPVRNIVRLVPKRGVIVNKKLIFSLAAAAVVILAVITYTSYPPATEGTEATIGAAQRAQTPQMASKDVGLGDTSAQAVLQTETWDAIMKDEDLRSSLQDPEMRKMLEDSELQEALRNEAVRAGLHEAELARVVKMQLSSRNGFQLSQADLASINNQRVKVALSNDLFKSALSRHAGLAKFLLDSRHRNALASSGMQRLLSERNLSKALASRQFAQDLASYDIKK